MSELGGSVVAAFTTTLFAVFGVMLGYKAAEAVGNMASEKRVEVLTNKMVDKLNAFKGSLEDEDDIEEVDELISGIKEAETDDDFKHVRKSYMLLQRKHR